MRPNPTSLGIHHEFYHIAWSFQRMFTKPFTSKGRKKNIYEQNNHHKLISYTKVPLITLQRKRATGAKVSNSESHPLSLALNWSGSKNNNKTPSHLRACLGR